MTRTSLRAGAHFSFSLPSRTEILTSMGNCWGVKPNSAGKYYRGIESVFILDATSAIECEFCKSKTGLKLELTVLYEVDQGMTENFPIVCCMDRESCRLRAAVRSE